MKQKRSSACQVYVALVFLVLITNAFHSPASHRSKCYIDVPIGRLQSVCFSNARLTSPPLPDLERQVVSLGRTGDTDEALKLYFSVSKPSIRLWNGAIDACSRARPPRLQQAFDILADGLEKKLKPNVFSFGSLVSACSRAKKPDLAIEILRSMEVQHGVTPNAVIYSTAISACSRAAATDPSQYKRALSLLTEAENKHLNMSVVGYNAALGACSNAGKWEAAIHLLTRMEDRNILDAVSYGTVMAACENGEEWDRVLHYADVMISRGFPLDGLALTSALHACQQKGFVADALRYLEILKASPKTWRRKTAGWERSGARGPLEGPDSVAYRLAISACARGGDWKKGIELLEEMRNVTGKVDVIAYTSAITGCEYAGEWKTAFSILETMRKDNVEPNEVTMAATIGACATACAKGWDVDLASKKALQLLTVMKRDPSVVNPNIAVYNAAIRACAEANLPGLAFKLLEDAEKHGLEPTVITFGTLMTACERASSLEGMERVFQLMKAASIAPNEIVYGAALSCLRKTSQPERSFLLLNKMVRDNLHPNVATFNTVLITQSEARVPNLRNMIGAYKLMASSAHSKPNRQTYGILVRAFCSCQQPQAAETVIQRMREHGIKPDVDLYTLTVTAFEKARQPLKALSLMESMERDGYDFYSVKVLNNAFKNAVKFANVVGKSLADVDDNNEWSNEI